jgi:bifunctional DNA-binding transcriptional regulator/antitoxin component of YhaV-PrlF toxin-antitoxin module
MRFFKHGESLAIVLPESLRKALGIKENDEYEFIQLEEGVIALVKKQVLEEKMKRQVAPVFSAKFSTKPSTSSAAPFPPELEHGYRIIENELEARNLSKRFEREIKSGLIKGVRGFDKRFYVVSMDFYGALSEKILAALEGETTVKEISEKTGENEAACTAVLQVMKEEGDVIEKKRGVFRLIK